MISFDSMVESRCVVAFQSHEAARQPSMQLKDPSTAAGKDWKIWNRMGKYEGTNRDTDLHIESI